MATIASLRAAAVQERKAKERDGDKLADEMTDLTSRVAAQNRPVNSNEQARAREIKSSARALRDEIEVITARIATLDREQAEDDDQVRKSTIITPTNVGQTNHEEHRNMSTTTTHLREEYNQERDRRGERSFFSDMYNGSRGDVSANARMSQWTAEQRATSTGSFAGLVLPQYLVDQAAILARAGRPFANSVVSLQIPDEGVQLLLPRGTTGASAAVQAAENTSVSSTDEVWANVSLTVATIAGQQDVSRQSIERGTPGLDRLVYSDLAGAYGVGVDQQVLSGSGAAGQVLGLFNQAGVNQATAFTAAATATSFWLKVAGQIAAVSTARGMAPTHIAMHPRRYAWLVGQVDTQGRPLVLPSQNGGTNAMGALGSGPEYGIAAGQTFAGLQIVVDANLPIAVGTGPEDQVVVYRAADLLLFENGDGLPSELRFEQTLGNQLTVKLVSYGYIAFTAGRYPQSVGLVGGNAALGFGLVSPTF